MLYTAKTLQGYKLDSLDGEIGRVKEFYFDDRHWTIRYLVADTGNWLTGRQVLISPYALNNVIKGEKDLSVALTKKQIENSPRTTTMVIMVGRRIGAAHPCGEIIPTLSATGTSGGNSLLERKLGIAICVAVMR
jgi:hypothetical protein